jgi:hypothetical protein
MKLRAKKFAFVPRCLNSRVRKPGGVEQESGVPRARAVRPRNLDSTAGPKVKYFQQRTAVLLPIFEPPLRFVRA